MPRAGLLEAARRCTLVAVPQALLHPRQLRFQRRNVVFCRARRGAQCRQLGPFHLQSGAQAVPVPAVVRSADRHVPGTGVLPTPVAALAARARTPPSMPHKPGPAIGTDTELSHDFFIMHSDKQIMLDRPPPPRSQPARPASMSHPSPTATALSIRRIPAGAVQFQAFRGMHHPIQRCGRRHAVREDAFPLPAHQLGRQHHAVPPVALCQQLAQHFHFGADNVPCNSSVSASRGMSARSYLRRKGLAAPQAVLELARRQVARDQPLQLRPRKARRERQVALPQGLVLTARPPARKPPQDLSAMRVGCARSGSWTLSSGLPAGNPRRSARHAWVSKSRSPSNAPHTPQRPPAGSLLVGNRPPAGSSSIVGGSGAGAHNRRGRIIIGRDAGW